MAKQYLARLTFEEELRRQQQYTEPECRCPVCGSVAENPVVFALNGTWLPAQDAMGLKIKHIAISASPYFLTVKLRFILPLCS